MGYYSLEINFAVESTHVKPYLRYLVYIELLRSLLRYSATLVTQWVDVVASTNYFCEESELAVCYHYQGVMVC